MHFNYDVLVIGGGHAGCEAACASANMGAKTCLVTMDMNKIAQMSCNPAIGGIAKGQIVREIDALGGQMGLVTDATAIQFRMLNVGKGPAVWSPRAQCDRGKFIWEWRRHLDETENLDIWQDQADELIVETVAAAQQQTVLFSGDAFGCFGALNGAIIDEKMNCDVFWGEMERYYSNIVGKYGTPVQNALKKLADVKLDYICATHGPVWHQYIDKVIGEYDRMSKYETEPGLVICYGTMYGNTERAAEVIARAASEAGVKNIVVYNVSKTHHSYIIRDVFRYKGLIVGAPTYNTALYHEMDVLLSELAGKDIKNHLLGWFGSFGWASKAVAEIQKWNDEQLHYEAVGEPVEIKQSLTAETKAACEALGRAMAERLKEC